MKPWFLTLREIAQKLPEGDAERLFYEWLTANHNRLREATADLGVTIAEGDGFLDRLQASVTPRLIGESHAEPAIETNIPCPNHHQYGGDCIGFLTARLESGSWRFVCTECGRHGGMARLVGQWGAA
jgi:hypothetical protein